MRLFRQIVDERHKRTADLYKPVSGFHVRDIRHLKVGDTHQFGKLFSVRCRLIQHHNQFRVGKHGSCRVRLEQIFYVLRNTRNERTVFTNTLPKRKEEVCRILVLEQQIDFVEEDIRLAPFRFVRRNAVQNTDRELCQS